LRLRLRSKPDWLMTNFPAIGDDWHLWVAKLIEMHVSQKGSHGNEASDGKHIDRGGRFFANVDLLMRDVIANCEGL